MELQDYLPFNNGSQTGYYSLFGLIFFTLVGITSLKAQDSVPKVLVVIAHPDDESVMAATLYKITHELSGIVDIAIITNGEGGFRYSLLSETIYRKNITEEPIGRKELPQIRRKEMEAAGKILGIRTYYWLNQKDTKFGTDIREPLDTAWETKHIEDKLREIVNKEKYDFLFCLLPEANTHAHHQAASLLALRAVGKSQFKPVVLGVSNSNVSEHSNRSFAGLDRYPQTNVFSTKSAFKIDRNQSFGYRNKLTYKIIVNWIISEYKSQGAFQMTMNQGDFEEYWFFDINEPSKFIYLELFMEKLLSGIPGRKNEITSVINQ